MELPVHSRQCACANAVLIKCSLEVSTRPLNRQSLSPCPVPILCKVPRGRGGSGRLSLVETLNSINKLLLELIILPLV